MRKICWTVSEVMVLLPQVRTLNQTDPIFLATTSSTTRSEDQLRPKRTSLPPPAPSSASIKSRGRGTMDVERPMGLEPSLKQSQGRRQRLLAWPGSSLSSKAPGASIQTLSCPRRKRCKRSLGLPSCSL